MLLRFSAAGVSSTPAVPFSLSVDNEETRTMSYLLVVGDAVRLPLADQSVDFVFGSPPYCDARTYGIDAQY
jgi:hypothetical protein